MTDLRAAAAALAVLAFAQAAGAQPEPPPRPAELRPAEEPPPPPGEEPAAAPLPPVRPPDLGAQVTPPATPPATPADPPAAPPAAPEPPPADLAACDALLASGQVRAERAKPGAGEACALDDGVSLQAVLLPDGKEAKLGGGVTVRCAFAATFAAWLREDVAPRLARDGAALTAVNGVGGLECRTRNHQPGAKVSEHARGAALDLRTLETSAGRRDLIEAEEATRALREDLKTSACARFSTVLGPGSDPFHADHIHLDMAERRNGYKMCQWEVR
ncbi:MAG TPA: extensin family protein [Beijerinckiaceae bacterium]